MSLNYPDPESADREVLFPYDPTQLTDLSLGELYKKAATRAGKRTEEVTAADVADFMMSAGATEEQMVQVFDPDSVDKILSRFPAMRQRGFGRGGDTELATHDAILEQEATGLELPEFAKRFQQASGIGMSRIQQLRNMTKNPPPDEGMKLSQSAFPVQPPRPPAIQIEKSPRDNVKAVVGGFFSDVGTGGRLAFDHISELASGALGLAFDPTDQVAAAAPRYSDMPAAQQQMEDLNAAEEKRRRELPIQFGATENPILQGLGAMAPWNRFSNMAALLSGVGLQFDQWGAEIQVQFGRLMALSLKHELGQGQPFHGRVHIPTLGLGLTAEELLGDPTRYEDPGTPERLQEIIDNKNPQLAREFMQVNTTGWFPGAKGAVEQGPRIVVEAFLFPAIQTPMFVKRGFAALPKHISPLLRPLRPLLEKADRHFLKKWKLENLILMADEQVKVMNHELETGLRNLMDAVGAKTAREVRDVIDDILAGGSRANWSKRMQAKYFSKNPALSEPRLLDMLDNIVGSATIDRANPGIKYAMRDLMEKGMHASELTKKMYANPETRPPLPGNWGREVIEEMVNAGIKEADISPTYIIDRFVRSTLVEYARSIGYDGPRVMLPFGLRRLFSDVPGNMSIFRYLSLVMKSQIGEAWLLSRPGFAVLNLIGGMVTTSQQQGMRMAQAPAAWKWVSKLVKEAGLDESMIFGQKAKTGSQGLVNMITGVAPSKGLGSVGTGDLPPGLFGALPIIGRKIIPGVGDIKVPIPRWMDRAFEKSLVPDEHLDEVGKAKKKAARNARVFNLNQGLVSGMKSAVSFTETNQHRFIQLLVFYQTARRVFRDAILETDLPDTVKKNFIKRFNDGDPAMFNDQQFRSAFLREVEEHTTGRAVRTGARKVGAGRKVDLKHALGFFDDDGTQNAVSVALDALPENASGAQIAAALRGAAKSIQDEGDKLVDDFYEKYPGEPGHFAHQLLKYFRGAGGEVDDESYAIMGAFIQHEEYIRGLRTRIMDTIGNRINGVLDDQGDREAREVIQNANRLFDKISRNKGKATFEISAKFVKNRKLDPDGAGIVWREEHTALMQKTAKEYEAAFDDLLSTEMLDVFARAVERGLDINKALAKNAPGGVKNLLNWIKREKGVMAHINREMRRINEDITRIRKASKDQLPHERAARMADAQNKRMMAIQKLYDRVAKDLNIELPSMTAEKLVIDEQLMSRIVRMVDEMDNAGAPKLEGVLLKDSIHDIITERAQEQAKLVTDSIEDIVTQTVLSRPSAVAKKKSGVLDRYYQDIGQPRPTEAAQLSRTTADDVRANIRSALTVGRLTAEDSSIDALFSYQYNSAEAALQTVMPYPYWSMKFFMFQMRQVVKNPGQYLVLARIMNSWYEMDRDLPPHLRGTIRLVTLPGGTQIRLDPKQFVTGGFGAPLFEIMSWGEGEEGEGSEFGLNLKSLIQVFEMLGVTQLYPHLALALQAGQQLVGEENVKDTLPPDLYEAAFGPYGIVPSMKEIFQGLPGSTGGIAKARLGAGEWGSGDKGQNLVLQHGMTEMNVMGTGKVLTEMLMNGEIDERSAYQALLDLKSGVGHENPVVQDAASRYFHKRAGYRQVNWFGGGVRSYPAVDRERFRVQKAYWELTDSGRVDEAKALMDEHPWVAFSWVLRKDLPEIQARVTLNRYFWKREELVAAAQKQKASTDTFEGVSIRAQIDETTRENLAAYQKQLGLTDEQIGIADQKTVRGPTTGPFLIPGGREKAIKQLVSAYFDMNRVEDYESTLMIDGRLVKVLEQDGLERYLENRDGWVDTHIDESMLPLFQEQLSKNITLPDAILRVFSTIFAQEFFRETRDMSPEDKERWLMVHNVPSALRISQEVQAMFPDRWVQDTIMSKVNSSLGSIRGYFNVRENDKMDRVRRGSSENPFVFQTSSGKTVTKDNLNEFAQAKEDLSRYVDTKKDRDFANREISNLTDQYKAAMARLRPLDFAANLDDPIREKYYGSEEAGTVGLIGIEVAKKELNMQPDKNGKILIYPWTDRAQEWYGKDDEEDPRKSEAMIKMRDMFYRVSKKSFQSEDGTDWEGFYNAQEAAFDEAVELGNQFGITEEMFRADLYENLTASEAAWRYWQEAVIQPIMAQRSEIKEKQNGLITRVQHDALAATSPPMTLVRDVMGEILSAFPHISSWDLTQISFAELPSFSEYWTARGYAPPKPSSFSSSSSSSPRSRQASSAARSIIAATTAGGGAGFAPPTR